jgi:glycine cleavage system H protein
MSELEYPDDLLYTVEHEWVRLTSEGSARVGITAYAQQALGDVVYVSLPEMGSTVSAGDACGEIESTKSVSDLFSPLSGNISAVNHELDSSPELINSDPYGEGWIYEMSLTATEETDELLEASAYIEQL